MQTMRPPHYVGVSYCGSFVGPGSSVDVADHDVEALLVEGWEITDHHEAARVAVEDEEGSET